MDGNRDEITRIGRQKQLKCVYTALDMNLYVHIPFCDGKCAYCSFYSVKYSETQGDAFLDALAKELAGLPTNASRELSTVYLGGGTPSALIPSQLSRLTELITKNCAVTSDVEWTVEGSPNTLTKDKVSLLMDAGVNRISVGIQCLDEAVLSGLGRRHSAAEGRGLLEYLAGIDGLDVGCDLIAGLPGHTSESWRSDLQSICDIGLTHASVYALSIEKGTPFSKRYNKGELTLLDEDGIVERLEECEEILATGGLDHYEVSNYAVKGKECRHNLSYWRGSDYLGVGPGASGRLGLLRRTNTPDVEAYINGADVPREDEMVSREEDLDERLMYHFRLKEGVDLDAFCEAHSVQPALRSSWEERLKYLCDEGLVGQSSGTYAPTKRGMDLADAICEVLLS